MNNRRQVPLYYTILSLSLLLQLCSLLYYTAYGRGLEEEYVVDWAGQYRWVVLVSLVLTLGAYLKEQPSIRIASLLLRYILIFVVYLPTGIRPGLKQMFISAYLMDLSFLVAFPFNISLGMGAFLSVAGLSALSRYHSLALLPRLPWEFLLDSFSIPLIIFFVSLFRHLHHKFLEEQRRLTNQNATINKLTDANTGFQHYVKVVEEKSSEDERNRIVRELHDSLGYTMTTIIMLSESGLKLSKKAEHQELVELMEHINSSSKTGLTDIRIALRIMKPKRIETISYARRLQELTGAFQRATNVKISLDYNQISETMDSQRFHLIFRLIQEGMINSFRHGGASELKIELFQEEKHRIIVTVSDNGRGFRELSVGLGLKGLEERLGKIGGEFSIYNTSRGVTLRAMVPLGDGDQEE